MRNITGFTLLFYSTKTNQNLIMLSDILSTSSFLATLLNNFLNVSSSSTSMSYISFSITSRSLLWKTCPMRSQISFFAWKKLMISVCVTCRRHQNGQSENCPFQCPLLFFGQKNQKSVRTSDTTSDTLFSEFLKFFPFFPKFCFAWGLGCAVLP